MCRALPSRECSQNKSQLTDNSKTRAVDAPEKMSSIFNYGTGNETSASISTTKAHNMIGPVEVNRTRLGQKHALELVVRCRNLGGQFPR